jgi:zinc transporter, ZIP family
VELSPIIIAFGLTAFAGLSTGFGSIIACCTSKTSTKSLSVALGFSAGVMIYVSFMELFPEGITHVVHEMGKDGAWIAIAAFFVGILIVALIDRLLPSFENPHEAHKVEELKDENEARKSRKLFRMGILTALAISLHNFPEGMATFFSAINDVSLGVMIAIAVAIHNIPEGIAVSIPIFHATGSRKKAFTYSFLSGLAEPVGGLLGYLLLSTLLNGVVFGAMLSAVAGIMVFISLDQLLPAAREYGEHHLSVYGLVTGMAVMAASLLLLS